MPRIDTIKIRRDLASNWTSVNPVLAIGEMGYETNTLRHKFGNGTDAWNDLPYAEGQSSQTPDTGSTIPLDNIFGNFCNLQSANSNTSYTINSNNIVGSYAVVLINASTEPTITGATQQGGVDFIADTDLELLVQNRGDAGIVYSFMPVAVGGSDADTLQSVTERGATTDQDVTFDSNVDITGRLDMNNEEIHNVDVLQGNEIQFSVGEFNSDLSVRSSPVNVTAGDWDASTNTPELLNTDIGLIGTEYVVSVAGTVDFGAGNITFNVGDIVSKSATVWFKKVDNNQLGSLKEQNIIGSRVDATVSGAYDIDLNNGSVFKLTMTGNTVFSFSNLPTGTDVKAFTVILTGDFVPTLPAYCELTPSSDTYDGTVRNRLIFDVIEGTTSSEDVIVTQENLAS